MNVYHPSYLRNYLIRPSRVICVEFDACIVQDEYPKIGPPVPLALETLKLLTAREHRVVLWTTRFGSELADASCYLDCRDIFLSGVNAKPRKGLGAGSPKVVANYYIDPRAIGCPLTKKDDEPLDYVDWEKIQIFFKEVGVL